MRALDPNRSGIDASVGRHLPSVDPIAQASETRRPRSLGPRNLRLEMGRYSLRPRGCQHNDPGNGHPARAQPDDGACESAVQRSEYTTTYEQRDGTDHEMFTVGPAVVEAILVGSEIIRRRYTVDDGFCRSRSPPGTIFQAG